MKKSERLIFLDNINTTFPDPEVVDIMAKTLGSNLGNPASHVHSAGINAGLVIDGAREEVSKLINLTSGSLLFTSGATESNNMAIRGFFEANRDFNFAATPIEHFSILNQTAWLRNRHITTSLIDIDSTGTVDLDSLEEIVKKHRTLVSIALANPEIGTIQDISAISRICLQYGAVLHCDCTAAAVLVPIDIDSMGIDMLTMSAHNIYGPMGVGALYVGKNIGIAPIFAGGNQESGLRPGTENVPGIAGMGAACRVVRDGIETYRDTLTRLGRKLWRGLEENVRFINFTGHPINRLPGHVSFWVEHVEGESLLLHLNMKGIMASSGSACSSNLKARDEEDLRASHVLTAVGVPDDICAGSITFSMSKDNTEEDVDSVLTVMPEIVERLLQMSPSYEDYKKGKELHHG